MIQFHFHSRGQRQPMLVSVSALLVVLLSACATAAMPLPTLTPVSGASLPRSTQTAQPSGTAGTASLKASSTPSAAQTRAPTITVKTTPPTLTLQVTEPADESIVRTSPITVTGKTSVEAVVSVNDNLVDIDAQGVFRGAVRLTEGPNTIEVVVSDFRGNQVGAVLLVIYEP